MPARFLRVCNGGGGGPVRVAAMCDTRDDCVSRESAEMKGRVGGPRNLRRVVAHHPPLDKLSRHYLLVTGPRVATGESLLYFFISELN